MIEKILGKGYSSGDEVLYSCPACKHAKRKMSLNFKKNNFKCWICDYKGRNIFSLVRKYGSYPDREQWKVLVGHVDIDEFQELKNRFRDISEEPVTKDIIKMPEGFNSLLGPISSIYYKNKH